MPAKQFAVIGMGRFGASVARTLSSMGYEVLGLDSDESKVNELKDVLTHALVGDATEEEVLESLGLRNFDCVVVAVRDIESSIMITVMLKEMGVKQVIAKASGELHGRVLAKVGVDRVVYPERDMGARIAQNLVSANMVDFIELSSDYSIAEIVASNGCVGKSLSQLSLRQKYGVNVVAIKRGSHINVSPNADDVIERNDILVVIGNTSDLHRLEAQ
jgi:trk system potassium uptake protein